MKKLLTILGSVSAVVAAPLSTVAMTTETDEMNNADTGNSSIKLNESEIKELESSNLGIHLNRIRKNISVENIDNIKQEISNSSFSERIKSYLYKRVEIQLNLNEMFKNKSGTQSHNRLKRSSSSGIPTNFMNFDEFSKGIGANLHLPSAETFKAQRELAKERETHGMTHHWFDTSLQSISHPSTYANVNEEITIENAFNPAHYITKETLTDASGQDVKYNHGQTLYVSGGDRTWKDHHLFGDDVTIYNVSNKSVWKKAEVYTHWKMSQTKEAQALKNDADYLKGLLKSIGVNDNSSSSLDIAKSKFQQSIDTLLKSVEDTPMYKYIKHFLWFKNLTNFKDTFLEHSDEGMGFWENVILTAGETGAISTAVGSAAGLISSFFLTPAGGALVAEVVGTLTDALLNTEMPNGASVLSNMLDHGLNDWKFQWNNNAEAMSQIEFEFSEGCLHGVSWKVKDTMWRTPDLWIRPGQTTDAPWVKLSMDVYIDGRMRKQFVWGEPVRFRNYRGRTNLKTRLDSLANLPNENFRRVPYHDIVEVGIDPWLNLETGGVEYSGSHRYFHVSVEYGSNPIAASPEKTMHENDHDDDNVVKGWNWKAAWANGKIELSVNDILHNRIDKGFQMRFGDGRVRAFPELDDHMKSIQRKALEYARFVQKFGMYPIHRIDSNGKREIVGYKQFDPTKIIVPRFTLEYVRFDRIKFNTYDDKYYDHTHSDHFRFGSSKIAIGVEFREFNQDEI